MSVAVSLSGVSVAFDGRPVVVEVDLDVPAGGRLALLGPSGSGKSTILRVIAGLQAPTSGTVRFDGRDVTDVPAERRRVGFVFQDHALFPHLGVGDNIAFGLRHGPGWTDRSAIGARVEELVDLLALHQVRDRRVDRLSGGESQRVAIARALAPRPSVLVLDEPFGALDQALRERLLDEFADVFDREDVTVVVVTHDPSEAAALAPTMAVLANGRVQQVGSSVDVLARPVDVDVARLLGHRNLVPGSVVGVSGGLVLVPAGAVRVGDGPMAATVTGTRVRGGIASIVLDVDGHRLETAMPPAQPAVGSIVAVTIDLDAVVPIADADDS